MATKIDSKVTHIKEKILLCLALAAPLARAEEPRADIQFFGDVYLPARILDASPGDPVSPTIFGPSRALLGAADHNVVNLEGVLSSAFAPYGYKEYLLRMPPSGAELLSAARIDVVTLANNHSLDFGFAGLLETMTSLASAGIAWTGAGVNREHAAEPVLIPVREHTVCLLAFSRTLPASFWATKQRAGTAFADQDSVMHSIEKCAAAGFFPVVAFHWGRETRDTPLPYQRDLAHVAIDAGARLVIGHHPHVLQEMEVYKDRPIFYSLGNFAFGTEPLTGAQEGAAVRLTLPSSETNTATVEVVPLVVRNSRIHFRPRPLTNGEPDPFERHLPKDTLCQWQKNEGHWRCPLTLSKSVTNHPVQAN